MSTTSSKPNPRAPNDLQGWKKEASIDKQRFTKKANQIKQILDMQLPFTEPLYNDLMKKLAELDDIYSALHGWRINILSDAGVSQPDVTKYTEDTEKDEEKVTDLREKILKFYSAPTSPTPAGTPSGGASKSKNRPELKPEALAETANPGQLESWIRAFTSYFTQSNFAVDSVDVQQSILLTNLEAGLKTKMEKKFAPGMPVIGATDSCLATLSAHWNNTYPLISRRLAMFRLKQAEGEKYTTFLTRLANLESTADLQSMTAEQIYVLLALQGCQDAHMVEKLLEIPKLAHRNELETKAYEVERRYKDTNAILPGNEVNALKSSYRRQKEASMSPSDGGGSNSRGKNNRIPKALQGLCLCCGQPSHKTENCKDKDTLSCTHCGKEKHNKAACFKLHWEQQRAEEKADSNKESTANIIETAETTVNAITATVSGLTVQEHDSNLFSGRFELLD